MRLEELLDYVWSFVNDKGADKIYASNIVRYLNSGIKDFCAQTGIYEFVGEIISVAEQKSYPLLYANGSETREIYDVSFDGDRIFPVTLKNLFFTGDWSAAASGVPTMFSSVDKGDIILHPTPSAEYAAKTVKVYGAGLPPTASYFVESAKDGVSPIGTSWDMALIYYATLQALASIGLLDRISYFQGEYRNQIISAVKQRKRKVPYKYTFYPSIGLTSKEVR